MDLKKFIEMVVEVKKTSALGRVQTEVKICIGICIKKNQNCKLTLHVKLRMLIC